MKEFIEKLIGRLEEYIETAKVEGDFTYIEPFEIARNAVDQLAQEYNNGWILCSDMMPKEHDSILAKFKGTEKWKDAMFEKISDEVNVTVVGENGKGITTHAHTVDGEWSCDFLKVNKTYRVTHWQPLPEPYQTKGAYTCL